MNLIFLLKLNFFILISNSTYTVILIQNCGLETYLYYFQHRKKIYTYGFKYKTRWSINHDNIKGENNSVLLVGTTNLIDVSQ